MSYFSCPLVQIKLEKHPNADLLEIAKIFNFECVVGKGLYEDGELGVYIPEDSIVPEWALKHFGYWDYDQDHGILFGKNYDRVKMIVLRKRPSQGLFFPLKKIIEKFPEIQNDKEKKTLGFDYAEILQIEKYVHILPEQLIGKSYPLNNPTFSVKYDVENIKRHPDVFKQNEEVVCTEKIHGVLCQIGFVPEFTQAEIECYEEFGAQYLDVNSDENFIYNDDGVKRMAFITSKGLGEKGFAFCNNQRNLYVDTVNEQHLFEKLFKLRKIMIGEKLINETDPLILIGEIYGDVQDLTYGANKGQHLFRAFDVAFGRYIKRSFLSEDDFDRMMKEIGVDRCPVIYRGPFSKEKIDELTHNTNSVLCEHQMREGIVIKPVKERVDYSIPVLKGRVMLKSVNLKYSARKNKNATEFN